MHLFAGLSRRQPQGPQPSASPSSNSTTTPTSTQSLNFPLDPTPTSIQPAIATVTTQPVSHGNTTTTIIAVVAVVIGVSGILIMFFLLRSLRRKYKNPKYIPTSFLKKRWENWEPKRMHYRLPDANDHLEPISTSRPTGLRPAGRSSVPPSSFDAATRAAVETAANAVTTEAAGVDRNTSVRSVMTLPAYHQNAMQNEQVLAREGERGGIDVVIEFPEGADEEEARREEEMEALYQVRLARRRENEEREERRRLRREARERGDYVALREIQARARASSNANAGRTVDELRAEHERIKKERQRAVSSVSYADLGVARHDGTRIRANSVESEREGLLGDAASFAASSHYHRRDRSASSVLSIDTTNSDLHSPGLTRSRANSRGESSLRRVSTSQTQEDTSGNNEGRAGSSPEMIEHEDVPPHSPPGYENISLDDAPHEERPILEPPPGYSSPVVGRGERRSAFEPQTTGLSQETRPSVEPTGGRAFSATHVGQLVSDRRVSSSSSLSSTQPAATPDSRRSSRGVGGTPQLPSLRLAHLPSIQVEAPSPAVRRNNEHSGQDQDHHPEE